jgi:ketosteroid isomerase-like protein
MQPSDVVAAFVARINHHDIPGLGELMTDDHVFVDALDGRVSGCAAVRSAWEQYFRMVPDYWIRIERTFQDGLVVGLFGVAGGTYEGGAAQGSKGQWSVPAAWLAETRGDQVALWRVYADNLPIRRLMGAERAEPAP